VNTDQRRRPAVAVVLPRAAATDRAVRATITVVSSQ
jgi:hypothetical protein